LDQACLLPLAISGVTSTCACPKYDSRASKHDQVPHGLAPSSTGSARQHIQIMLIPSTLHSNNPGGC
jgi:hypothetical protein